MRRCFYSGTETHPVYVDHFAPAVTSQVLPIVMLHGGCHTGACYLTTPDGRDGWADLFSAAGHPVYVPDWPGHGRSPIAPDFHKLSGRDVVDAIARLIEEIGPVVLMSHSASGPMAWQLAERLPDHVLAVVGLAPGAPANIVPVLPDDREAIEALRYDEEAGCPVYADPTGPVWVDAQFALDYWSNGDLFPAQAFDIYRRSIVPESPQMMNERFNIGGSGLALEDVRNLGDRPMLVITGSMDPRHPRVVDEATATYLGADFIWLADRGIEGNGHMLMLEENSAEIAQIVLDWLARRTPKQRGDIR